MRKHCANWGNSCAPKGFRDVPDVNFAAIKKNQLETIYHLKKSTTVETA